MFYKLLLLILSCLPFYSLARDLPTDAPQNQIHQTRNPDTYKVDFLGVQEVNRIDNNSDGQADILAVDFKLRIYQPGSYRIQGSTADSIGHIEFYNISADLSVGEQIVTYQFSEKEITNINGNALYLSNVATIGPVSKGASQNYLLMKFDGGNHTIIDYPDLIISDDKSDNYRVRINNNGKDIIGEIAVAFYYDDPINNELIKKEIINGLAYNEEASFNIDYVNYKAEKLGNRAIYVVVNADKAIKESDYTNNSAAFYPTLTTPPEELEQRRKLRLWHNITSFIIGSALFLALAIIAVMYRFKKITLFRLGYFLLPSIVALIIYPITGGLLEIILFTYFLLGLPFSFAALFVVALIAEQWVTSFVFGMPSVTDYLVVTLSVVIIGYFQWFYLMPRIVTAIRRLVKIKTN